MQSDLKLKTIMLYGHLGSKFGRVHRFVVSTPKEAIRALCANFPGFRRHLIEHSTPGYRVKVNTEPRGLEELSNPVGQETIRIIPVLEGSGNVFKIILGAALVIFAPEIAGFIGSTLGAGTGIAATIAGYAGTAATTIGVSLVLQGASGLLFKAPKQDIASSERPENQPSYNFNGPVNRVAQGHPVAICYGRLIIGSHVISAGLSVEQIA